MSAFITKEILGNGLIFRTHADGTEQVACPDCNNWVHAGSTGKNSQIRHSKRCGFVGQAVVAPTALDQARSSAEIAARRAAGESPANGLSGDERLELVQKGLISVSEAMNSDY